MLNKYLKCSVWRLALLYDIYIYMSLGFKRLNTDCLENRPGKIRKDKRHKTVVGIATRYELVGQEIESRWWGSRFFAPVQTGTGTQPANYTVLTGSFLGVKRPGCGVDHPPPSRAEVKERVELYLYSPSGPSWSILG